VLIVEEINEAGLSLVLGNLKQALLLFLAVRKNLW